MLFGSGTNKKEKISLLIDVGNGSIGGAFVKIGGGALPKILYNIRLPLTISEKPSTSQLFSETAVLLDELLAELMKHGFSGGKIKARNISDALITFSSPWFLSRTKKIHIEQEKAFVITKNFLEDIAFKEEQIFESELPAEGDSEGGAFEIVEKSIVHTKINGYTLEDSIGKSTKIFDAFLFLSIMPKIITDTARGALLKHAHIAKENITIHTFPLASFSVVRDLYHTVSDFVLIDISGEVTDMTLVHDNVIIKTVSFPSGRNFIIRQISKSFGVSSEIAESTLHIYNADKAENSVSTRMEEALADAEREWSVYFEDGFSSFGEKAIVPAKVYMTADSDVVPVFTDFLKLPKTDVTAGFRKNADIVPIDHAALAPLCESDIQNFEDEFIAILAIFFAKQSTYVTM